MRAKELYLHTSNHIESLARRLIEVTRERQSEPLLAKETVMTLNPGMARWLQFEIAQSLGVSFGWEFPFPGNLFQQLLAGFEPRHEHTGLFNEHEAQWALFELLGEVGKSPEFALLQRYCERGPNRRLQLARKLAWLFDQYLLYRPDAIVDWESGRAAHDWQAELWRQLLPKLFPGAGKPPHIARVWQTLKFSRQTPQPKDPKHWPNRISVFGVSALPSLYIDLLDTVSNYIPVHLFLLQPTDLYWADLKSRKQIARATRRAAQTQVDDELVAADESFDIGNPLLPSFGKQGQAFLDLILDKDPIHDDSTFIPPEPSSQLAALQSDLYLLENRFSSDTPSYPFPQYDGSIQIHNCSNQRREVETLWDYLIRYFSQNPGARASQVLVMAPDIQAYAGHIDAVFSENDDPDGRIPYSIADQSGASSSRILSGATEYLEITNKRATAGEVTALLKHPATRDAFRFSDNETERIEHWIRESGVTWGWDQAHRESTGAFPTNRNTWTEFQTRLAAGMAFPSNEFLLPGGNSPLQDIEGDGVELAGRLNEFLQFLADLRADRARTDTVANWSLRVASLLDRLKSDDEIEEIRYRAALESVQERLPLQSEVVVSGADAYTIALDALSTAEPASGYLSGHVTFCSLKPMRSIPSQVICLLGMDDESFPRKLVRPPFDLLAQSPRRGDRNTRDEDKQFFLETLLAARERLFISYCGISRAADTPREPSIVVAELRDYLQNATPGDVENPIVIRHKRQSYHFEYFQGNHLYTYSSHRADLCRALHVSSVVADREFDNTSSAAPEENTPEAQSIAIESLVAFLKDPQTYFVKNTLGVRFHEFGEAYPEIDPLAHEPLARYSLLDRFASAIRNGVSIQSLDAQLLASFKLLPPGHLESLAYEELRENAYSIQKRWEDEQVSTSEPIQFVSLNINGRALTGPLNQNRSNERHQFVHPGKLRARHAVEYWIRHLVLNALAPTRSRIRPLLASEKPLELEPIENASNILSELVDVFETGTTRPFPHFPQLSWDVIKRIEGPRYQPKTDDPLSELATASQAAFESAARSERFATYPWTSYQRACFGETPPFDTEYAETAYAFWNPFRDAVVPGGNRL